MTGPFYENMVYIITEDTMNKFDPDTGAPNIVWSNDRYKGSNVVMCHPMYLDFLRDMFFLRRATKVVELPESACLENDNWS